MVLCTRVRKVAVTIRLGEKVCSDRRTSTRKLYGSYDHLAISGEGLKVPSYFLEDEDNIEILKDPVGKLPEMTTGPDTVEEE